MFCERCGKQIDDSLNFCNGCGERLARRDDDHHGTPGKMLDNVLTTLFLIVMFGLGILVGLVAVLLGNAVKTEVVTVIVIAYLASVFGICFTLLKQVPKLIDAKLNRNPATRPEFVPPAQLTPRTTAQLEEHRQPASVTDSTTRILDKIPLVER